MSEHISFLNLFRFSVYSNTHQLSELSEDIVKTILRAGDSTTGWHGETFFPLKKKWKQKYRRRREKGKETDEGGKQRIKLSGARKKIGENYSKLFLPRCGSSYRRL